MKRILVIVTALAMLFCAVPCEADSKGVIETMQEMNDDMVTWYQTCLESLFAVHDAGKDSDSLAICVHHYMAMYDASNDIKSALIMLPLSGIMPDMETLKTGESANVAIAKYYMEQYEKYIDGELTASEYVDKMKRLYEIGERSRKEVEKKIEDMNK